MISSFRGGLAADAWPKWSYAGGPWPAPETASDFAVVFLPDPQMYQQTAAWNDYYRAQMRWIIYHQATLNIQAVIGLGDNVNERTTAAQWDLVKATSDLLLTANIPNLIMIGNHDYDDGMGVDRAATLFNEHFPVTRYTGSGWWNGGFYDAAASENLYYTVTIGSYNWLFLVLEVNPRAAVQTWADGIIAANPTFNVVVTVHDYMNNTGNRLSEGDALWTSLIKKYANVRMVGSGHVHGSAVRSDAGDNANMVWQWLSDYQADSLGGSGYLAVARFKPSLGQARLETYSPVLLSALEGATQKFLMTW